MTIKSDIWIERMARERNMISPFLPEQVKQLDGKKIISAGVSSYGYDMRVADEWKVFANTFCTIVDPKGLDERAFVDMRGDHVLIPPNSFALARSVERFVIPEDVLCIVLGKCVTGDTRVVDATTGDYVQIRDFDGRNATVGIDGWKAKKLRVDKFFKQGVKDVFRLRTKRGREIKATPEHPFRTLDGWRALKDLRPGDKIAVAREIPVFGSDELPEWEAVLLGLMISEGACKVPGGSPIFTNEDPVLVAAVREAVEAGGLGVITHDGRLGYRCVNRAGRGGVMTGHRNRTSEWLESHGAAVKSGDKCVPGAVFRAKEGGVKTFLRALFSGDGSVWESGVIEYYSDSRVLVEDVNHLLSRFGIVSTMKSRFVQGKARHRVSICDFEHARRFASRVGFMPGSMKQAELERIMSKQEADPKRRFSRFDALPSETWPLMVAEVKAAGIAMSSLGFRASYNQAAPRSAAAAVGLATGSRELADLANGPLWDAVASIEYAGCEEVFDISVPGAMNFIANGIVVHNSSYARVGIVVNVTPLEPCWEGHVTIEVSNTTPLPAKVYSNEGIAQVLFFQSDERCRTSYSDKNGKYMHQPASVVLPRM